MLKVIKQLFGLLTDKQLKQFYVLQVLVIIMAFTELLGIASIAPFMALVGDIGILETNDVFAQLYQMSGLNNTTDFLFYAGVVVLVMLTFSTVVSMFTIWKLSIFGARIGTEIADRLYSYYMQQSWQFHASGSSAQLTKQVSTEAARISNGIIQPLFHMNAKLVLSLFISISIVIYDPLIAILGLSVFSLAYFLLYRLVRKKLVSNGQKLSQVSTQRFRLMNEGFGGIKDVLLLNRSHDFIERFHDSGKAFARAQGTNIAISQVPRYFIELIAFGAMISLVLVLIKLHAGNLGEVLPILAVYALAAFKLLPALQQIYSSVSAIKGNVAAFEAVKKDLEHSIENQKNISKPQIPTAISLNKSITLNDIEFSYPNKDRAAVDGVNMSIPVNSVIGLVGSSGSGKSTLIDLLLGLLTPQQGSLYVDDIPITADNRRAWQDLLGFVPQSIFLSEGTIAENIAFGLPAKDISITQVNKALTLANLTELVEQLPDGINTKVGERGVQLSGGQRQRIGIARALYHEAEVLVFDEATSALDGITEKIVMDAIHEFSGKKTIIMIAHRLKTVEKCDLIYFMENGKIIDHGTYQDLVVRNMKFKEMAKHA
ncbi:ABC transporter ATP-binding protein [Psychrobacter sp. Sarcosine-3u-12]|uniref:ABC transporter ATP-binding protein n=1 Tax=Psychrobacter sp. Sarcosine-3u-12 TaxID=2058325 RepID=UPI000C33B3FF|nr:ABC transporter ATP-binding protein [Psychrobacter sp. Sarcosine-3u-12]PKG35553.1 multidrug ABC transporter ATP-binding protein [Psychrobacter sp. Sarcosine-3u-12]